MTMKQADKKNNQKVVVSSIHYFLFIFYSDVNTYTVITWNLSTGYIAAPMCLPLMVKVSVPITGFWVGASERGDDDDMINKLLDFPWRPNLKDGTVDTYNEYFSLKRTFS